MPETMTYAYKVRDRGGKVVTGTLAGESQPLVLGRLRETLVRVQREAGGADRNHRCRTFASPPQEPGSDRQWRGEEERRELAAQQLRFHVRRFANPDGPNHQRPEQRVHCDAEPESD